MSKFREYLGLPDIPSPVPHWSFPPRMSNAVAKIVDYLERHLSVVTTKELHVYADGTSGDDTNDGLSPSRPKKTLGAVFALVPDQVKHFTAVHLSGNFVNNGEVLVRKTISQELDAGTKLIVDGGSSVTIVDDNSGSNYSSTDPETSTSSIGDSVSASWTTDEHVGYLVEVLTGSAAGQVRMIHSNTSNTLVPTTNFSVDPGAGASFRVVRPATTFSGTTEVDFCSEGKATAMWQRLYLTGASSRLRLRYCKNIVNWAMIVSDSTKSPSFDLQESTYIASLSSILDPVTGSADSNWKGGVSVRSTSSQLSILRVASCNLTNSIARVVDAEGTYFNLVGFGCRFYGGSTCFEMRECQISKIGMLDAGSAVTKFDGATGIGLKAIGSVVRINSAVNFSDNGSHGIQADNSTIRFGAAAVGTGNTGAGVHAKNNSTVLITDGSPPTLTGTVGNLSFDGTTQKSTWAAIDGGTPAVESTNDIVVAKEA